MDSPAPPASQADADVAQPAPPAPYEPFREYMALSRSEELLDRFRGPIFAVLVAAFAMFGVLVVNHFMHGRWPQGLLTAVFQTLLFINAWAFWRQRPAPVPAVAIMAPGIAGLGMAMYTQGLSGLVWAYPAILLFHFLAPRRMANAFNLLVVLMAAPLAWMHLGGPLAARITATLLLLLLFTNIFSFIADNQQRKASEQRQRLDLLVRGTNAGTLEWDAGSNTSIWSPRLLGMLGHPPDADTTGWNFFDRIHADSREHIRGLFMSQLREVTAPRRIRHLPWAEYRLRHADGSDVWVHAEAIAVTGPAGRMARYVCSFLDITERERAAQALRESHAQVAGQARQLEQQNAALLEAMRMREEVERIARHDLRTPLNSIASVPRLLRELREPSRAEEELLDMVERSALRVLRMVNLSLDLHRMEEGAYPLRAQPLDLGAVARAVLRDVLAHAATKGARIELSGDEPPVLAHAEELLCYSIVANLLKNALEAVPDGGTVRVALGDDGSQWASMTIHNDGAVPASVRGRFFEKYATYGKAGGTGLGAYSARLMARVQHGELTMDSTDALGTTLTLRLPRTAPLAASQGMATQAPGHDAARAAAPLAPLKVLLVDDDDYNIIVLRAMLPSPPLRVGTAINGRAALSAVAEQAPDLIFMDLEMPVMGGLEATRRIRQMALATRPVIVAFSAHDDEATRDQCAAAGFDLYLSKPATAAEIMGVLRGERVPPRPAASMPPGGHTGGPITPAPLPLEVQVDADLAEAFTPFLESRRALAGDLLRALDEADAPRARQIAHKLAGGLAMYGLGEAAELARTIERQAAGGMLADDARERAVTLADNLRRLRATTQLG